MQGLGSRCFASVCFARVFMLGRCDIFGMWRIEHVNLLWSLNMLCNISFGSSQHNEVVVRSVVAVCSNSGIGIAPCGSKRYLTPIHKFCSSPEPH